MADFDNGPHAQPIRRAHAACRCGAKTRKGGHCQGPAMPNGRCRMHGGKSTGPRTPEGLERCRRSRWKHGWRSRQAIERRKKTVAALRMLRFLARLVREDD